MPDPTLSQALKEAYAACPSEVVVLHTLEIRHATFKDARGNPQALRWIRDHQDRRARLEESAPLNAGKKVLFKALSFDFSLPPLETTPLPEITVQIDNVSQELMGFLDDASKSFEKIEMTYRPYLSDDFERPQMDPPLHLILKEVEANALYVRGRASMMDLGQRSFPGRIYTLKDFPGLKA